MKSCRKCGVEQRLDSFSPDRRTTDGRQGRCKACDRAEKLAAYAHDPEKFRVRAGRWRDKHPEAKKAHDAAYRRRHPGSTDAQVKWMSRNKERVALIARAGMAVQRALRRGALVRPPQCAKCAKQCRPEASHTDYSRPLEVSWLCMSCHRTADRHEPKSILACP